MVKAVIHCDCGKWAAVTPGEIQCDECLGTWAKWYADLSVNADMDKCDCGAKSPTVTTWHKHGSVSTCKCTKCGVEWR